MDPARAKFWLDPAIELADDYGLGPVRVNTAQRLIEERQDEVRAAWNEHFGR